MARGADSPQIRLNKFLARHGVASRRRADLLIRQGRVTVNGQRVTEVGAKVSPGADVRVDGQPLGEAPPLEYVMLHKPAGYVTTRRDFRDRPTVMDLLPPELQHLFPVGRLDQDTTGLLLLTNDGELTFQLTHPRHECEKTYVAVVEGELDEAEAERLRRGIVLKDGKTAPAKVRVLERGRERTTVELTIHEGRKRQVRRMFQALGKPVVSLARVRVGPLCLGELAQGQWRRLSEGELRDLREYLQRKIAQGRRGSHGRRR